MVVFEAIQSYTFNIDFLDLRSKMIDNEGCPVDDGGLWGHPDLRHDSQRVGDTGNGQQPLKWTPTQYLQPT